MAQTATERARDLSGHVRAYMKRNSRIGGISMTDATEAIWGTSGRGNPNAVRLIEACATLGFLRVRRVTKTRRVVELTPTSGPVPEHWL